MSKFVNLFIGQFSRLLINFSSKPQVAPISLELCKLAKALPMMPQRNG